MRTWDVRLLVPSAKMIAVTARMGRIHTNMSYKPDCAPAVLVMSDMEVVSVHCGLKHLLIFRALQLTGQVPCVSPLRRVNCLWTGTFVDFPNLAVDGTRPLRQSLQTSDLIVD